MFVNQIWGIIAVKGVYIGQYVRFSLHSHININIHPQYRLSVSSIRYVVFVKKAKTVCGTVCCAVIVEVQVNLHNKTLNTRGETVHRSHGSVSNFFRVRYNFVTVGWKQTNKQKIQARFLYWCRFRPVSLLFHVGYLLQPVVHKAAKGESTHCR